MLQHLLSEELQEHMTPGTVWQQVDCWCLSSREEKRSIIMLHVQKDAYRACYHVEGQVWWHTYTLSTC
jgi:hypothetical protein